MQGIRTGVLASFAVVFVLLVSTSVPVVGNVSNWQEPTVIDDEDAGSSNYLDLAVNINGDSVAVWSRYNGTDTNILANRYEFGIGWTGAVLIDNSTDYATEPQVAMDSGGNATVIWLELNSSTWIYDVRANRYEVGSGWIGSILIENNDSGGASSPALAMDDNGNAIAVWAQNDGSWTNIWANRYDPVSGWETPELLELNSSAHAYNPAIAIDDDGNAIAVWLQVQGLFYSIWANRYESGVGWGSASGFDSMTDVSDLNIDIDRNGDATVVWNEENSITLQHDMMTNRYEVDAGGWQSPVTLASDFSSSVGNSRIVVDENGNAIAVWTQSGIIGNRLYAAHFELGVGWDFPVLLVSASLPTSEDHPDVDVDQFGNAMIIWSHGSGSDREVWVIRYEPDSGWGSPHRISSITLASMSNTAVGFDRYGNALAIWSQSEPLKYNVWANRYTIPDLKPPVLSISNPIDGQEFNSPVITVSGTTEPGVTLTINGILVAVEFDGAFSIEIVLLEGDNTIAAVAMDSAGNPTTVSISVSYASPITDLQDELISLRNELNAIRNELNSTEEQLYDVESDLEKIDLWRMLSIAGLIAAIIALILVLIALMQAARERRRIGLGPPGKETSPPPQATQPSVPSAPSTPKAPDKPRPKSRP